MAWCMGSVALTVRVMTRGPDRRSADQAAPESFGGRLGLRADLELAVDGADVKLHRAEGDREHRRDVRIRRAARQELQHLRLTRGERRLDDGGGVAKLAQDAARDARRHRRAAAV